MFLGNGEARWAEGFRDRFAPGQRVLSDPRRRAYRAMGMARGVGTVLDPRALEAGRRAVAKGFIQGRTRGAAFQQGGVLVIGTDGRSRYAYKSAFAGDHPEPDQVLAALVA